MKCNTCGKDIPDTSTVCPFCYSTVVPVQTNTNNLNDTGSLTTINTSYQSSNNDELNFGDLNNTNYDEEHNTLKTYFNEPKKRKKLLIPIILVLVVFVGLFVILSMFKAPTIESYKYYTNVVDKVYDYLSDNFTSSSAKNSGSYKLVYTINGETTEFKGKYAYDLSKKLFDITGDLKDPEKENGGVIVGNQTFTFELYGKNNELYLSSTNLFEIPILLPYEDETGLLNSKQYDLDVLVDGIHDAINYALKNMNYTEEKKVKIDLKGKQTDVKKKILTLDYNNKKKFLSLFFKALMDDSNFTSEYAKIIGKKMDDVETLLNSYKTTYEYKYSTDDGKITYINIYYKGTNVYKIEVDNTKDDGSKYIFDLDTNKISFTHLKDGRSLISMIINRIDTTMNDVLTRNYIIEYKDDNTTANINIELTKDNNPTVKGKEYESFKSIRDMSDEEINVIKNNVKVYTESTDIVDNIREIFKTKCNTSLSCICNGDTCSCTYNNSIINCPKDLVKVEETTEVQTTE